MDDHPLAIFAFFVVIGALIVVKGFQNFLGNVEASVTQNPLRAVRRLLLLCALTFAVGLWLGKAIAPLQSFACVAGEGAVLWCQVTG